MYKVLLDSNKYLLSCRRFINPLEPDVHNMTLQILSILIDFTQTAAPLFQSFSESLDLHNSGTRKDVSDFLKYFQIA